MVIKMVKWINSWAQGIIIAVIISTIIEMILPDGNIKKYIRTVIGTYIVFVIISPIVSKITGKEIKLSEYEFPESSEYKIASIDTNSYIESTYINNIKQEITKDMQEKGYKVENIELEIEQTEESYGNINKMKLKISKADTKISTIEPININVRESPKKEVKIDESEIQGLKEFLKENYGTKLEDIYLE